MTEQRKHWGVCSLGVVSYRNSFRLWIDRHANWSQEGRTGRQNNIIILNAGLTPNLVLPVWGELSFCELLVAVFWFSSRGTSFQLSWCVDLPNSGSCIACCRGMRLWGVAWEAVSTIASFSFSLVPLRGESGIGLSIGGFFSGCGQFRSFLQIWSHRLKKSLTNSFPRFILLVSFSDTLLVVSILDIIVIWGRICSAEGVINSSFGSLLAWGKNLKCCKWPIKRPGLN